MQRGGDAEAIGGRAWPPAGADPLGRSRRRWRLPIVAARHGPGVALPDVVRLEAGLPAAGPPGSFTAAGAGEGPPQFRLGSRLSLPWDAKPRREPWFASRALFRGPTAS